MIILGRCEGAEVDQEVYREIAQLLSQQIPNLEIGNIGAEADPRTRRYGWRATLGDYIKVNLLADALWDTYKRVLQAHESVAHKIKLVFRLEDSEGNFVRVQFADPYSDKNIYMHCFEENMASAFGRA